MGNEQEKTLFHITNGKAGSQWIYKILHQCSSERIIAPQLEMKQFLKQPILSNKIYPTLYITYQQFSSVKLPENWKRFIVIRDLRDVLISLYFSLKISHPVIDQTIEDLRKILISLNTEEGFLFLINNWLEPAASIQHSWLEAKESLIHYEDLLYNDVEILTPFIKYAVDLPITDIEKIIIANRFEKLTNGRERGNEDLHSHERKGEPGDWRNYFNERMKNEFKNKYGDLLVKLGYEKNNAW